MPHSDEVHGASATPLQVTGCYSNQNPLKHIAAYHITKTNSQEDGNRTKQRVGTIKSTSTMSI